MQFTKMHGIGNDFVVFNHLDKAPVESGLSDLSKRICDRKFGVGADGIILVLPSKVADYKMRMLNPDGSEAEMCGNGIRCFAKYLFDHKLIEDSSLKVDTLAGIKNLKLSTRAGKVEAVKVDMGQPRLRRSELPMRGDDSEKVVAEALRADGRRFEITGVSMGNPHVIIFEQGVGSFDLARFGPQIEHHKSFPQRTNVHFVQVCSTSEVVMRTWERGAGITLACGTGACAVAVACVLNEKTGRRVQVHLPGGDLLIEWNGENRVMMTGPAETVFTGDWPG